MPFKKAKTTYIKRVTTAKAARAPKYTKMFPRRLWPISRYYHALLSNKLYEHCDTYLLYHKVTGSYVLTAINSDGGRKVTRTLRLILDRTTGKIQAVEDRADARDYDHLAFLAKEPGRVDLVLARDSREARRAAWRLIEHLEAYYTLSAYEPPRHAISVMHHCYAPDGVRRWPTLGTRVTAKLPDIL